MYYNDPVQLARYRWQEHEAYIDEQTSYRSLMTRRSLSLSVLILLLFVLFSCVFSNGCAPPVVADQVEAMQVEVVIDAAAITGFYRIYDGAYPSVLDLAPDGAFRRAASETALSEAPVDAGRWSIEDEVLVLTSDDDIETCGPGRVGRYQISEYDLGGYQFKRLSEECEARIGFVPTAEVHPLQATGLLCEFKSGQLCANK